MIALLPPASVSNSNHQTSHFFTGFIREPALHWKSRANSWNYMMRKLRTFDTWNSTWLLENGPWTLNIPGEWTPVLILFSRALSRYLEHQVLAALIQNIWTEHGEILPHALAPQVGRTGLLALRVTLMLTLLQCYPRAHERERLKLKLPRQLMVYVGHFLTL